MRLPEIRGSVITPALRRSPWQQPWSLCLCAAALLLANVAHGLDENRLWLPRAKKDLRPELVQAAQLAESSAGCKEVISGELDAERSAGSMPVFRIVCRNAAGYTYSVSVTNAGRPNAKVENVQSAATIANSSNKSGSGSSASAKSVVIDEATARQKCLASIKLRTERMAGVTLQEADLQRLEPNTGTPQYELNFDAADPSGLALRFQAMCRVSAGGTALVEVKPRRAAPAPLRKPAVPASQKETDAEHQPVDTPSANQKGGVDTNKTDAKSMKPATEKEQKPASTEDDGWEVVE